MGSADYLRRAVFLDRDGVINRALVRDGRPYAPRDLEEFELLPGVIKATEALHQRKFRLIVITNQPDVGAGRLRKEVVEAMHLRICQKLPIDDIRVCYHIDEHNCDCRKPKPGLIFTAARDWSISLSDSYMVGDRWRDVDAGRAAGCKTILVKNAYNELQPEFADAVVTSFSEASQMIIAGRV
mgnify:CR=1 FL=1